MSMCKEFILWIQDAYPMTDKEYEERARKLQLAQTMPANILTLRQKQLLKQSQNVGTHYTFKAEALSQAASEQEKEKSQGALASCEKLSQSRVLSSDSLCDSELLIPRDFTSKMSRALKLESLDRRRRLTAIWILITNPETSLMNYKQLHKLLERFQYFSKEFHFPDSVQWTQMGVYHTISIKPINSHVRGAVSGTHQFENELVTEADGSISQVLVVPRVHPDTPFGMGFMLTDEEYIYAMENFEVIERQRHKKIKHLRETGGKQQLKDMEPLIPKHRACQVCKVEMAKEETYQQHVDSRSHKISIHSDPFYDAIDDLIGELNLKNAPASPINYCDDLSSFS